VFPTACLSCVPVMMHEGIRTIVVYFFSRVRVRDVTVGRSSRCLVLILEMA
jgi:hypothetical protein